MRISDWIQTCALPILNPPAARTGTPARRCCIVMAVTLDQVRTMRIGLVVDSACDLPKDFIERHSIEILPIAVRIDGTTQVDYRDQAATLALQIGRAHVCTPVTNAHLVSRTLLYNKHNHKPTPYNP